MATVRIGSEDSTAANASETQFSPMTRMMSVGSLSTAGDLDEVGGFFDNVTSATRTRFAIYQGGTTSDPNGATLKYDSGEYDPADSSGWVTITGLTASLVSGQATWIYFTSATTGAGFGKFLDSTLGGGSAWDTTHGELLAYSWGRAIDHTTTPASTFDTTSWSSQTQYILKVYFIYTEDASVTVTPTVGTLRTVGQTPSISVSGGTIAALAHYYRQLRQQ